MGRQVYVCAGGISMAGHSQSKMKSLAVYDYLVKYASIDPETSPVTMSSIIEYVSQVTGETFDRKSIYSDITNINDYVLKIDGDMVNEDAAWIKNTNGRYYKVPRANEISLDEARSILDAIQATPICDETIAEKVKDLWPNYFDRKHEYVSFTKAKRGKISATAKKEAKKINVVLNEVRKAIMQKSVIHFTYGYKMLGEPVKQCEEKKTVSPIALFWQDNKHYFFGIDNDVYVSQVEDAGVDKVKKDPKLRKQILSNALRQYRLSRVVDNIQFVDDAKARKLMIEDLKDYVECDFSLVNDRINYNVDGMSMDNPIDLLITLKGNTKLALRAFNHIQEELAVKTIVKENLGDEYTEIGFYVTVTKSNTFYAKIANVVSFISDNKNDLSIEIKCDEQNKSIIDGYKEFIRKAAEEVTFEVRS